MFALKRKVSIFGDEIKYKQIIMKNPHVESEIKRRLRSNIRHSTPETIQPLYKRKTVYI